MSIKLNALLEEFRKKNNLTKEEMEEYYEDIPLKNTRRTLGGIVDELATGSLTLARDFTSFTGGTFVPGMGYVKIPEEQLPTDEDIQAGVSSVVRPLVGKDIYDGDKIQSPEGITGKLAVDVAPFLTVASGAKKVFTDIGSGVDAYFKKTAKDKNDEVANALRSKKINAAATLASAEAGSQVVFADDPELFLVANFVNDQLTGTDFDDNVIADIFNYLDADDNSSVAQKRLSLLLDGAVFSTLIGGALKYGGKPFTFTKEKLSNILQRVKENPETAAKFKRFLAPLQNRIQQVLPKDRLDDDVFVPVTGPTRNITRGVVNLLRDTRRKYFTSRGYYSAEMHSILKDTEYAKVAQSREATQLFTNLTLRLQKIAKEGKLSKNELDLLFEDYMIGKIKLKNLPKKLQPLAQQARNDIDELSSRLLETQSIPEETKRIIRLNLGSYLRKSYELFENPKYRPSESVIEEAIESVAAKLQRNTGLQRDLFKDDPVPRTAQDFRNQAETIITNILDNPQGKNTLNYLDKVFGLKQADIIFQTRKEIDEPLQKLFGERTAQDTPASVFTTLETLSHYITDAKMYDDLYKQGYGKWFFDENVALPASKERYAATIDGEKFLSLNGLQTTDRIAEFFNKANPNLLEILTGKPVFRELLMLKGYGQAFATVYSLTTHARNTIGGGIIMASNGLNPFDTETRDSFKLLTNELYRKAENKDEALTELYNKYQRLGLVNQNVRVGEFKNIINDATTKADWVKDLDNKFASVAFAQDTKKLISAVNDKVNKTYVAEDDLWRIAAFQKELQVLRKAFPNRSLEELEKEAATVIRNTFPTYDLVPLGAREIRQIPLFGNFYSFVAERWRNNYHTLRRGFEEINSGNPELMERGYQRLGSKLAVGYAGAQGLNTYTKHAYGVTDEEEETLKDLAVPYWSKNGTLIYKRDNLGNLMFADSTFSDPDAPILTVLTSATNVIFDPETPIEEIDELYGKALLEAIRTFSEPFVDQPLLSGQIIEALDGKDENENFIEGYNPQFSFTENAFAIGKFISEVLVPRALKEGFSYTVGEKSEKLKSGDIDAAEELISKITGQRFYKVDNKALTTNLFFKMKDFIDDSTEIKQIVTGKAATPEDQMSELIKANRVYYRSYTKLAKAIKAARVFNVDEQEIRKLVNDRLGQAGLNSDQRDFLLSSTNSFQGLRLTENQIKKAQALDPTFKEKYQTLNTKLSYLPTYDLEYELPEERQEAQKEAVETLQGRRNFVDGAAVSKDYPVPFASEVPAEREDVMSDQSYETQANAEPINPFTGKPYTNIYKKRIGLRDGSKPLTFNQQYHRDTIQNKEAFQDINGNVVTANVIGVEYKGKIYNLPSYDRRGGFFTPEELRKKYEVEMETGVIKGYDKNFDGPRENHPANVAARREHKLMQDEAGLAREAINPKYTETPSKEIFSGLKAGMKALGL